MNRPPSAILALTTAAVLAALALTPACKSKSSKSCRVDSDCSGSQVCVATVCISPGTTSRGCRSNADCDPGSSCDVPHAICIGAAHDAGTSSTADAGQPGTADAGTSPDAGLDAEVDAGHGDASVDAGAADAAFITASYLLPSTGQRTVSFVPTGIQGYSPSATTTQISGVVGNEQISIEFYGTPSSGAIYMCGPPISTNITYSITTDGGVSTYSASPAGSCMINVNTYGRVGEPITGTFSGTLLLTGIPNNPGQPGSVTFTSGSFHVTRDADH